MFTSHGEHMLLSIHFEIVDLKFCLENWPRRMLFRRASGSTVWRDHVVFVCELYVVDVMFILELLKSGFGSVLSQRASNLGEVSAKEK